MCDTLDTNKNKPAFIAVHVCSHVFFTETAADEKLEKVIENNPGIIIEVDRELAREAEMKKAKDALAEASTNRLRRITRAVGVFNAAKQNKTALHEEVEEAE